MLKWRHVRGEMSFAMAALAYGSAGGARAHHPLLLHHRGEISCSCYVVASSGTSGKNETALV